MASIRGEPVVLIENVEAGTDAFGAKIYTTRESLVHNVLIAPSQSEDVNTQLSQNGRRIAYTLAIPKGDTHTWEGGSVRFFEALWRVVGIPMQGIDKLIPLDWNKKVQVERIENM